MFLKNALLLIALTLTLGCFDTTVELINPNESIRVPAFEGDFVTFPQLKKGGEGEGWFRMESGEVKLQWDEKAKSVFFDKKPRDPRLPKGVRSSDTLFKTLRTLCLDANRRIYLLQMMDPQFDLAEKPYLEKLRNNPAEIAKVLKKNKMSRAEFDSMIEQDLARKPRHQILIVKLDAKGAIWGGEEETWFKTIPGLEKELEAGDGAVALRLIKDHLGSLRDAYFEGVILGPGKLADYGK